MTTADRVFFYFFTMGCSATTSLALLGGMNKKAAKPTDEGRVLRGVAGIKNLFHPDSRMRRTYLGIVLWVSLHDRLMKRVTHIHYNYSRVSIYRMTSIITHSFLKTRLYAKSRLFKCKISFCSQDFVPLNRDSLNRDFTVHLRLPENERESNSNTVQRRRQNIPKNFSLFLTQYVCGIFVV